MASTKKTTTPAAGLDDILAVSSPAERVATICVDGRLAAEHQRLERELDEAHTAELSARLGGQSPARKVAERIREVETQMHERSFEFRFRAVSPKAWSDLMAKYPDPKGQLRFNLDTFPIAAIAACCVTPDGVDTVEAVGRLLEQAPHAHGPLWEAAWAVNSEGGSVPFSVSASAVLQDSAPSSTTADRLASPDPSSSGG